MSAGSAIRVRDLEKRYPGGSHALRGASFTVEVGSVFALLGRNGSGKTSTVRVLTGLTGASAGTVEVLGLDPTAAPREVQARIGVTLQEAAIDDQLTGAEFLTFVASVIGLGRTKAKRRAAELLALVDLTAHANRPVGQYSGGMQRRVDLAAALVRQPEILFLDEPTTGLDPQSRRALWDEIRQLRDRGTTIFLTTQYLEEAEALADEIAILDAGAVIDSGNPDALRARHGRTRLRLRGSTDLATLVEESGDHTVTVTPDGIAIELDAPENALELLVEVRRRGGVVADFEIRRDSLEDVFIELTGQQSGDGDGTGSEAPAMTTAVR